MPGMVKIGRTSRDPMKRAGELTAASGVPTPFKLEGYVRSPDAARTEAAVHRLIGENRVNSRREFFRIETTRALSMIRRVAGDERLVLRKPKRKRGSWLSLLHLLSVFVYFNAALAVGGFDHSVLWKAVAANAFLALVVPPKLWNRLMTAFRRRPLASHLVVSALTFLTVGVGYHVLAPVAAHAFGAAGL
jgi:hypothetical protein